MCHHAHADEKNWNIAPEALKPLFTLRPGRHLLAMAADWLIIGATIALCVRFFNPALYLLAVITIGARMHALAILMHDATHYRFIKNRRLSDRLTNWITMYPLFTSIHTYRDNHLRHHQHLNTEEDPDWVAKLGKRAFRFPKSKVEFLLTVLSYLVLYQGVLDAVWFAKRFAAPKGKPAAPQRDGRERLLFYAILFTVLTWTGTWTIYLLYWVVPYLSTFFMFQYIRSVAEHFGELAYDHLLTSTRTVRPKLVERFFIAPHEVGYHLEHHLYPGVPFYHLPQLHRLLMEDENYRGKAHLTQGYVSGLLNELSHGYQEEAVA